MLLCPTKTPIGQFQFVEGSHETTRPATGMGTTVTPTQNAFGSSVQVGADTTEDAYGILIGVNNIAVAASAKDSLTQIGFDFAGGTTFPASPDRYNSITLLSSNAGAYAGAGGGGHMWYFPLFIPAATAILARGSVNNATVGTQSVWWRTFCRPRHPDSVRVGRWVESLGITAASSSGTALTPGTTSEGTAVSVGTLATGHPAWWWEAGLGINDSSIGNNVYHIDLLKGSSTGPVFVQNIPIITNTGEVEAKRPGPGFGNVFEIDGGTQIFARTQVGPSAADTSVSVAVYALGG